jgi:hypothetical protein
MGSDFLYPTAFIRRFSLYPADDRRSKDHYVRFPEAIARFGRKVPIARCD